MEGEAVLTICSKMTIDFVFKSIIQLLGTPIQIITNNGNQFASKEMQKFCVDSEIKLSFDNVYHPKTNEQVEDTNKTIMTILKRNVGEHLDVWDTL